MNHLPKIDRSKEVEAAARLADVQERARAASPVSTGRDLLDQPAVRSGSDILKNVGYGFGDHR